MQTAGLSVIPHPLASQLAPTAGLRNRPAPEYETVVDRAVCQAIRRMIPHYSDYLGQIEDWLIRKGPGPA
jgi:uncharacterized protein YutE (UPF0331/DUF86 family)